MEGEKCKTGYCQNFEIRVRHGLLMEKTRGLNFQ